MRDASGQARSSALGLGGLRFYHPRGVGVGKDPPLPPSSVVAPPWYLVREYLTPQGQTRKVAVLIQISRREVLKFPALGLNLNTGFTPSPTQ